MVSAKDLNCPASSTQPDQCNSGNHQAISNQTYQQLSALVSLGLIMLAGFTSMTSAAEIQVANPSVHPDMVRARENNTDDRQAPRCQLKSGPTKVVTKIIDAVTLRLDDGTELRLTGLHPAVPAPIEAHVARDEDLQPELSAARLLTRIALGKAIELKYEKRRSDRYGRVLAHGFINDGSSRLWLQAELVRQGRALVSTSQGNHACARELQAIEQRARQRARGYWGRNIFRQRKAWKSRDLLKYRQTFQLVAGRVKRISIIRDRIYLNFGRNWKSDFTIVIDKRVQKAMKWKPEEFHNLKNKNVRVRGWIYENKGPMIRLLYPEDLEIITRVKKPEFPKKYPVRNFTPGINR